MAFYLGPANYAGNLRRIGFTDADLTQPGSDRIIDWNCKTKNER
jgi:hypothetical protein